MDRDQWEKSVTAKLAKLMPDKKAAKSWIEGQGFKVDSANDDPNGWWLSAENPRMTFTKLTVRWDDRKKKLSVRVD